MPTLVLVLSKDDLTREAVLYNLETFGYLAVGFEESSRASRALLSIKFDVLIMSTSHAHPSGSDLLKQARKLQPNLRTILVDGVPPDEAALPYVDAYVQRPFGMKSVLDALKQVLGHHQQSEPIVTWKGCMPSSTIH